MNSPIRPVSDLHRHEPADFEAAFEALVEPMARAMAKEESANCETLDAALLHQDNWRRIVPEARVLITAITPMLQEMLAAKVEECARVLIDAEPPRRRWVNREQCLAAIRSLKP